MKRITALLLAVALSLGCVNAALADGIDIKVKGQWDFAFGWAKNTVFKDSIHGDTGDRDNDNFFARQRIRTQIDFITSEYLQGVLMFEIGDIEWGGTYGGSARAGRGNGGGIDADGVNIETKRAYLDWIIPNTPVSVRMGIQGLKLPSTPMGSPLFDTDVAGIVVSSPITDWLSMTALWIRPFDAYANDGFDNSFSDEVDAFGLLLPMQFDGLSITPWGVYSWVGANSGIYDYVFASRGTHENSVTAQNSRTKAWWVGTHLELTVLEPLVFNFEAIYGQLRPADLTGYAHGDGFSGLQKDWSLSNRLGTKGWYLGATLDYKLDWMTPGIFGWWASGDSANDDHTGYYGRMPVLGNDGGSFYPTTFGTAGTYAIGTDGAISGSGTGTWGIGIQLADVSFIEDLSHTLRFAYYRGTNDSDLVKKGFVHGGDSTGAGIMNTSRYSTDALYLTNKDSVFEINFDHRYDIYENLAAIIELGYIHLRSDKDVWKHQSNKVGLRGQHDENENAWKAQVNFSYSF